jgi:hypothetical protein
MLGCLQQNIGRIEDDRWGVAVLEHHPDTAVEPECLPVHLYLAVRSCNDPGTLRGLVILDPYVLHVDPVGAHAVPHGRGVQPVERPAIRSRRDETGIDHVEASHLGLAATVFLRGVLEGVLQAPGAECRGAEEDE